MHRILKSIAAFVSWHRRAVGALLAAAAVLILATALRTPVPSVEVVVSTVSLPAGHTLIAADLAVRSMPRDAVPAESIRSPDEAVGQSLIAAMSEGTILQPGSLNTGHSVGSGRAVVPVSVPDETLRTLLRPGDAISLVAQGPDGLEVVSDDARVATLPEPEAASSELVAASSRSTGMILVEVASADAAIVASLGQSGGLSIVLGTL